jgi:glycerate kinase
MALKVLIVPDKFKGTLTAGAAADLIARGWREARPQDELELLPMSDGGDGFGEVLGRLVAMDEQMVVTVDAAQRPLQARWWWSPASATALIESANIIGLALLPPGKFHPFDLDTFGLGAALKAAAEKGPRHCLVGIGGSATNDGGFGVARALGWQFLDESERPIEQWPRLNSLERIRPPAAQIDLADLMVAVDVRNPLLGPTGATRLYGPQKGLRPEDFEHAETCLARLAQVAHRDLGENAAEEPGAGAAGGLGFGLRCFLKARLESGFGLFARYSRLPERIRAARIVITAEGAIDRSTLMGKGVGEIARLCRDAGVPCIGLAGTLRQSEFSGQNRDHGFSGLFGMSPHLTTPECALRDPGSWLPRLAAKVAEDVGGQSTLGL